MSKIFIINRKTRVKEEEKVYGSWALTLLYSNNPISKLLAAIISKIPFFSMWYGRIQKKPSSQKKIRPFIKKFCIDSSEFQDPVDSFSSFNDFFIRKLKKDVRPISSSDAVLFADARYFFFPQLAKTDGFFVKGKRFCLEKLLMDKNLADQYEKGSMVIARLCPTDYHRFHFPFDCIVKNTRAINGYLYSVNPKAIKQNIDIFTQNKRVITSLYSNSFEEVQYIEIGATYVGSIHQTYKKETVKKGDEKGYFSFGGSSIVLLFKEGVIHFDQDLKNQNGIEIYGKMGESMGSSNL